MVFITSSMDLSGPDALVWPQEFAAIARRITVNKDGNLRGAKQIRVGIERG
jgi:hypothetical protein